MVKLNRAIPRIQVSVFLILISLPLIGNLVDINTSKTFKENRRLEMMPSIEFNELALLPTLESRAKGAYAAGSRFIRKFNEYYSSRFGFRSDLLTLYSSIKSTVFKTNPLPQKVVEGVDGWYFLGNSYSNEIKESKGLEHFSKRELIEILVRINEHKSWLNKKGIQFYLAVAPNKVSVYGNYLPIQKSSKKTPLEQIDSASQPNFGIIDLKKSYSVPPPARLFFKTDSHWNDYGAFLGYTTLLQRVRADFPDVPVLNLSDFVIDTVLSYQQDLTSMLAIQLKEETIRFTLKNPGNSKVLEKQYPVPKNYDRNPDDYENRYKSEVNQIKVLVFHDSFTTPLKKYLNESFGEVVYIWRNTFDMKLIEKENPDIVIRIIVERNLEVLIR